MELSDVIASRRSIRKFREENISADTVRLLLDAARLAPSGSNLQPARFIVAQSPTAKEALGRHTPYKFIVKASVIFVCCAGHPADIILGDEPQGRPCAWIPHVCHVRGFCVALGIQPVENSLIAKLTPLQWRSTGYGLAAILIFGVGALAVYLVGWISARWSLGTVYLCSSCLLILIVVNIVFLLLLTRGHNMHNRESE